MKKKAKKLGRSSVRSANPVSRVTVLRDSELALAFGGRAAAAGHCITIRDDVITIHFGYPQGADM